MTAKRGGRGRSRLAKTWCRRRRRRQMPAAGGKILSLFILNILIYARERPQMTVRTQQMLSLASASDGAQEKELLGIAALIGNLAAVHRHQPGSFGL